MNKEIEKVHLDFEKLSLAIKAQKISQKVLAVRLGHHANWIADLKKKDSAVTVNVERFICMELGLEPGSLIRKEPEQAAGRKNQPDNTTELLERILEEQQNQREIMEKLAKQVEKADAKREDNSDRIEAIWNKLSNQAVQILKIRSGIERLGQQEEIKE